MALWFFQQLTIGLDYLHRMVRVNAALSAQTHPTQDICSRDLKLENTLVKGSAQSPVLKICDFGFSKDTEQSQAQTKVGTYGACRLVMLHRARADYSTAYMAPEIAMHGTDAYDGKAADVWYGWPHCWQISTLSPGALAWCCTSCWSVATRLSALMTPG